MNKVQLMFQFEEKLQQLKVVLPSSSEVKLAALLNREKGDLNAVVQYILEEPAEYEATSERLGIPVSSI